MGVVKSRTMYRADTGKVQPVETMTASHLLNAIGHHARQEATLEAMINLGYQMEHLKPRLEGLQETLATLRSELETRDPALDEERDNLHNEDDYHERY